MADRLILSGGTTFDGLGSPPRRADIVMAGQRIADLADPGASGPGQRVLDCDGLFVTLGFIDAHAHSDLLPAAAQPEPVQLLQGVTTEIVGNCGISFAPLDDHAAEHAAAFFGDLAAGGPVGAASFADYLGRLEAAAPLTNVAALIGDNALRLTANGSDGPLRPRAPSRMRELAADALAAGAVGLSTGLIYPPGCFADTTELIALAAVAGSYGGIYATHLRDEGRELAAALDEAIAIARGASVRLQVSHCKAAGRDSHGKSVMLLNKLRAARLDGLDVLGDQYPYAAGSTIVAALLPTRAAADGSQAMITRLRSAQWRQALRAGAEAGGPAAGLWSSCTPRMCW